MYLRQSVLTASTPVRRGIHGAKKSHEAFAKLDKIKFLRMKQAESENLNLTPNCNWEALVDSLIL